MIKNKRWILIIVLAAVIFLFLHFGLAQVKFIINYFMFADVVDVGGAPSQSTNYSLVDAIGQPGGIGQSASTNYVEASGFLYGDPAPTTTPVLHVSTTTLDFGTSATSLTFDISNTGTGSLTWTVTETPDKAWLTSIIPNSGTGNATVTVTVDRSLLTGSSDTGSLSVASNGGNATIVVSISKLPTADVTISAPNFTGSPGSTIDVPVSITDVTGKNVLAISFTIETATSVLTPTNINKTGTMMETWGSPIFSINGGQILISAADVSPLSGSGTLVYIEYTVNPAASIGSTTNFHFLSALLNEGTPSVATLDGLFTVSGGYDVSGTILYHQSAAPVNNATVTIDGSSTTTASDGTFSFSAVAGGDKTLTPSKSGDLKTSVSAFDASKILRYSVGLETLSPYQMIAADVSGNGSVSAFDASYVLQYTVGLITSFPVGADWKFVPNSFAINSSNWSSAPNNIQYSPLNSNQTNQDFTGIVYGDVSGNWSAAKLAKAVSGEAQVAFGEVAFLSPKEFLLPIKVRVNGNMFSAQGKLQFDDRVLQLKEFFPANGVKDFAITHQVNNGNIDFALAGAHPVKDENELVYFKFAAKVDNGEIATNLNLANLIMNEGRIAVTIENETVSLNPTLPQKYGLKQNYPNPFNPSTMISFNLSRQANVKISVFDVSGKEVRVLVNEKTQPGYHHIEWDGRNNFGEKVASGVYFYRMQINEANGKTAPFSDVKKMILMK
ncbi:MAG: T9SS type A sorting domain-containing protein [Calditrichaeota bacterium]|nr:T9SS type A sorting domain-containing protein [Calditrichota bacterium]